MAIIDTTKWMNFRIGSLFDIEKGTRLTKANMEAGTIPFVGASSINNGITGYIANEGHVHPGNLITITYNGSVGVAFYQEHKFWASDDVNVLYPKGFTLDRYLAFFFIPLLQKAGQKYVFADKWKISDMKNDFIRLPVDSNQQPDFAYMVTEMQNREAAVSSSLTKLQSAKKLQNCNSVDVSSWKPFKLGDLFDFKNTGNVLLKDVISDENGVPLVTAGFSNNGVVNRVAPHGLELVEGNCIFVGGKTFSLSYQEKEFISNDSHNFVMRLKSEEQSENVYLFLLTVLKVSLAHKYTWSDAVTVKRIKDESIVLPSKKNLPDFKFMDEEVENKKRSIVDRSHLFNIAL